MQSCLRTQRIVIQANWDRFLSYLHYFIYDILKTFRIMNLKQTAVTRRKIKITAAAYLYQADRGGEWDKIHAGIFLRNEGLFSNCQRPFVASINVYSVFRTQISCVSETTENSCYAIAKRGSLNYKLYHLISLASKCSSKLPLSV